MNSPVKKKTTNTTLSNFNTVREVMIFQNTFKFLRNRSLFTRVMITDTQTDNPNIEIRKMIMAQMHATHITKKVIFKNIFFNT